MSHNNQETECVTEYARVCMLKSLTDSQKPLAVKYHYAQQHTITEVSGV